MMVRLCLNITVQKNFFCTVMFETTPSSSLQCLVQSSRQVTSQGADQAARPTEPG
jgi:hypothetical protein